MVIRKLNPKITFTRNKLNLLSFRVKMINKKINCDRAIGKPHIIYYYLTERSVILCLHSTLIRNILFRLNYKEQVTFFYMISIYAFTFSIIIIIIICGFQLLAF